MSESLNSEYIVEFKHISKSFPGVLANDDISFGIKKGEIFAILGENGAGKSTLMSMLYGMYRQDSGKIFIRGKEEKISSPNDAVKLDIGMVHQHFKLVSNFTVTENIVLGMETRKKALGFIPYVDIKSSNKKIKKLSEDYGLNVDPEAVIEDLEVYEQQRVEILKMLYRESEILIFDEPTALLTPQEIEFLLEIISTLREKGKTVILITHKLEEIKKVADRCAILSRGKLKHVGYVNEISASQMARLMVGHDLPEIKNRRDISKGRAVLELKHVSLEGKKSRIKLHDVSFCIHEGEIFALAGVAGNGQSEIAEIISGMTEISSGEILFNGENISGFNIKERIERGISYIPEDRQSVGLVLDFPLKENLALKKHSKPPFSVSSILKPDVFDRYAEELIENYDIRGGGPEGLSRQMSGGNQQKSIVAREIELDGGLLIFVQPTRGLDVGAIASIHERILNEKSKMKAVLLISIELDEIMSLADTIGVIYNGSILKIADAEKISREELGEYMMGVKREESEEERNEKEK